jgi:hypothetical protein
MPSAVIHGLQFIYPTIKVVIMTCTKAPTDRAWRVGRVQDLNQAVQRPPLFHRVMEQGLLRPFEGHSQHRPWSCLRAWRDPAQGVVAKCGSGRVLHSLSAVGLRHRRACGRSGHGGQLGGRTAKGGGVENVRMMPTDGHPLVGGGGLHAGPGFHGLVVLAGSLFAAVSRAAMARRAAVHSLHCPPRP